jgi:hypothetical protein
MKLKRKIRVAFIYKPSNPFYNKEHFDNTTYYFSMHALKRNESLEVDYFPAEKSFDASKLKGKYDVIMLGNHNSATPDELIGIKQLDIPVIARCGDFHHAKKYDTIKFHEKYKIDYYYNFMSENYFYKFYPKDFKYKTIILGVEPSFYQNLKSFKDRKKGRILVTGALGKNNLKSRLANRILNPKRSSWYFYKLRTLSNQLPYVEHSGMIGKKYINDNFASHLSQYQAAIAATTHYPTIKYWETSASGCLTFMEISEQNDGKYLGYKDQETAIFINEKNYEKKFELFLNDIENPKWEKIASNGRKFTMENLSNDKAVETLVKLMKSLI